MKILLVYPQYPDTFWSFKHALKLAHKKASSPPLGLLTVAALLPETWGKRLIDLNVTKLSAGDLAWADAAFVSAMLVQKEAARQIIARCRQAGLRIIAGGHAEPPITTRLRWLSVVPVVSRYCSSASHTVGTTTTSRQAKQSPQNTAFAIFLRTGIAGHPAWPPAVRPADPPAAGDADAPLVLITVPSQPAVRYRTPAAPACGRPRWWPG